MKQSGRAGAENVTGHLCVDRYTSTLVGTNAVLAALELGLFDLLLEGGESGIDHLADQIDIDRQGLELLLGTLVATGVLEEKNGRFTLTEGFVEALEYRDLLEVRAGLSNLCALDLISCFSSFVKDQNDFMGRARLFRLFDYQHALVPDTKNLVRTRRWVNITTTLTKYEAGVVMKYHDFSRYRRILDIGGNSGELVLRICRRFPELRGTVFDLPVVCEIGRKHVAAEPEAGRIEFLGGDAHADPIPGGYDAVVFKSVLHDWPDAAARRLIRRAAQCVVPGGTLLIFERGPLNFTRRGFPYHLVPYLLFARFFRAPAPYVKELTDMGFEDVTVRTIDLETPFHLVTGNRAVRRVRAGTSTDS